MFQKQVWVKVGVLIAAVAMLCGCPPPWNRTPTMRYPKNTPIVISGGSITAHTLGTEDWADAKKSTQPNGVQCYTDGTTSQACVAHIDPTTIGAVALSGNFEIPISKATDTSIRRGLQSVSFEKSWKVVVAAVGPGNEPVNLTIQPVSPDADCAGGSTKDTCFSISTTDFGFGPRHETEGTLAGQHYGRSVCHGKNDCKDFSIQTVTIHGAATDPIEAKCDDPNPGKGDHGCLVCLKPANATDPCEWK